MSRHERQTTKFRRDPRLVRRWRTRLAPAIRPTAPPALGKRLRRLLWLWWPWAILCVVMLATDHWNWAIVSGTLAWIGFLAVPLERSPQRGLDHDLAIDSPEFLATMSGATGEEFAPGNTLTILNNGEQFYPAMLEAIERAQHSITIEAYIYWAGEIGQQVAESLAARSSAGVRVKILLDAVGSSSIGEKILETLEHGHCQVAWYNPPRWYSLGRLNHRTHRKSLIVDGKVGFTGGAGIADHWRGSAQDEHHWRDMQIRIEGSAVRALQTGFASNWLQTTGELISGEAFYPVVEPCGPHSPLAIMSSPEVGTSSVRTMYYLSISCARRSIYIANPYFIPDEVAVNALVAAKRRGVNVQIMVSGVHNDAWLARQNSVRLYGSLLKHGIVILEYNRTMLHQKTMVVDGVWATVGTTNFDSRSFSHNEESNFCVYDPDWAGELQRVFLEDARVCDAVELKAWQRRGLLSKTQEFFAAFLEDQV